ncbi:MAG TPA: nucleotidyltransferase domain-containing protein [Terriglobales bacterium]|nr:nucleotidyltransferase domain-containing protein [Terriglobales bacterium]
MATPQFENRLHTLISNSGATYEKLVGASTEVVIFGSRAIGVNRPDSDLDVLLVDTNVGRPRVAGIDFVILRLEELASSRWLGSELASHIAQYGKWIKGPGSWRHQVHISDRAAMRKEARIVGLLMCAPKWWSKLHPVFRTKYELTIRRELQRLDLLRQRVPVPPTHALDADWVQHGSARDYFLEVAATLPLNPLAFDLAKSIIDSPAIVRS